MLVPFLVLFLIYNCNQKNPVLHSDHQYPGKAGKKSFHPYLEAMQEMQYIAV